MDIYVQNQDTILQDADATKRFNAMHQSFKEQINLIQTHLLDPDRF